MSFINFENLQFFYSYCELTCERKKKREREKKLKFLNKKSDKREAEAKKFLVSNRNRRFGGKT